MTQQICGSVDTWKRRLIIFPAHLSIRSGGAVARDPVEHFITQCKDMFLGSWIEPCCVDVKAGCVDASPHVHDLANILFISTGLLLNGLRRCTPLMQCRQVVPHAVLHALAQARTLVQVCSEPANELSVCPPSLLFAFPSTPLVCVCFSPVARFHL